MFLLQVNMNRKLTGAHISLLNVCTAHTNTYLHQLATASKIQSDFMCCLRHVSDLQQRLMQEKETTTDTFADIVQTKNMTKHHL